MDISVIPGSDYNKELFEKLKNNKYNTDSMKYDTDINIIEMRDNYKSFVFSHNEALNIIEALFDPWKSIRAYRDFNSLGMAIDVYNNKENNTVTFTFYDKLKQMMSDYHYIYQWFPITIPIDEFEAFHERGLIRGIEKVDHNKKSLGDISPDILNILTNPINGFCKYNISYIVNSDKEYKKIAPYLYAG